jgi:hypothetical protein
LNEKIFFLFQENKFRERRILLKFYLLPSRQKFSRKRRHRLANCEMTVDRSISTQKQPLTTEPAPGPKSTNPRQQNQVDQWMVIVALCCLFCICFVFVLRELFDESNTSIESDITAIDANEPTQSTAAALTNSKVPTELASSGEQETCNALCRLFGRTFVKVRPPFLVNPETGRRLELDCFSQELMLGVEYNGIQHYVYPNPFHQTQAEFEAQLRRDRYKVEQCKAVGVRLVVVPFTIKRANIESYLQQEFTRLGFKPFPK